MRERYGSTTPLSSGRTVEQETFGTIPGIETMSYEKYRDAMEHVRSAQPWPPENPRPAMARDLRIEILDKLGMTDDFDRVKLYTAVGSPLDFYHGIDAFVDVRTGRGVVTVTLDVTVAKKPEWKAEILIRLPSDNFDPDLDTGDYLRIIDRIAEAIVLRVHNPAQRHQVIIDYEVH